MPVLEFTAMRAPCNKSVLLAATLLAAILGPAGEAVGQEEPQETFAEELEVTEVLLDVLVTDGQGRVILGLGKDIGSLEVGKLGNVVLFTGDPLDVTSNVQYVVIEGDEVYDRDEDVRNRHLMEGVQPPGTAVTGGQEGEHDHGKADEEDE